MSEAAIREYAKSRGFHPQTLERWIGWWETDRNALAKLALELKASENHVRDMMDWLEEISLRDSANIHDILGRREIALIHTHPRLGRPDKLKRIKEQLRRWRFPRLAAMEDSLAADVRALRLPSTIHVSAPPGFEGGRLNFAFEAGTPAELKELIEHLRKAAASEPMSRIFALLNGHAIDE